MHTHTHTRAQVDLYVGKTVVKRGIPNEEACDALVELIHETLPRHFLDTSLTLP